MEKKEAPHSLELEQEILGSLFLDDKLMKNLIDTVKIEDFYNESHKIIYKNILYLYLNNQLIDYTSLWDRCTFNKEDTKISLDYILSLADCVVNTDNYEAKIERLLDMSYKRRLFDLANYILDNHVAGIATENIVNKIRQLIDDVKVTSNIEVEELAEGIDDWYKDYYKVIDPRDRYLFGYKRLDDLVILNKTNLMLVSARPSLGKSVVALQFSKNFAFQGKKVLFVTLEMSKKECLERLISMISGVSAKKIKRKDRLSDDEDRRVREATKVIKDLGINIYYGGSLSISKLQNLARKLYKLNKLDVLVVDYIQLLNGDNKSNRNNEIGEISRGLKVIAQDLNIPIVALSQLSRASIGADGKPREPQLSDLRESGSLEQDKGSGLVFLQTMSKNKYLLAHF